MTYCVGILLEKCMIFASDSRTNAGHDNVAKFCKMTVFERGGDRVIVLLSSGNLAGTQAVINVLRQRANAPNGAASIWTAETMFDVTMLVSDAIREIQKRDGKYQEEPLHLLDTHDFLHVVHKTMPSERPVPSR